MYEVAPHLPLLKKFKGLYVTVHYFIQDAICQTLKLSFFTNTV